MRTESPKVRLMETDVSTQYIIEVFSLDSSPGCIKRHARDICYPYYISSLEHQKYD